MNNNIGILGGDLRNLYLSQLLLEDGYNVYTYGLEKSDVINNKSIIKCRTIEEFFKTSNNIISAIPFSKDEIYINSPLSNCQIKVDDTLKLLKNKTLIAGAINKCIKEEARELNINLIDLMENEKFTILNVIPTVEGAIQIAMENVGFTIHNSNCLVLGYGRIGKLLSKTLKDLGANVSVMARKEKDLSWIKLSGYKDIHINNLSENLTKIDIIFNTIPSLILDMNKLKITKEKCKDAVIIELASKPWGIDFKKAEEYNIKVIKAQGLPGKVAPYTAGKYIKEVIEEIIN